MGARARPVVDLRELHPRAWDTRADELANGRGGRCHGWIWGLLSTLCPFAPLFEEVEECTQTHSLGADEHGSAQGQANGTTTLLV